MCHYTGKLLDGTVFDSSVDRGSPAKFAPNQVIKGWTEALQMMRKGDKWRLWIPSELAYGDNGSGAKIPGGAVLEFELEVIEVQTGEVAATGLWAIMEKPALFGLIPGFQTWHLFAIMVFFKFLGPLLGDSSGGAGVSEVSARHILVKTKEECQTIKDGIVKGDVAGQSERFNEAAKAHSTCPSKEKGGSLGSFGPGSMVPAFDTVCFDPAKAVGEVHGPVETQFGYHLIVVDDRSFPESEPTPEVKKTE